MGLAAALRRNAIATTPAAREHDPDATAVLPEDALQWSWPPYAPVEVEAEPFDTAEWAPSSVVWHPHVRLGRWTVVYRRSCPGRPAGSGS